MSVRNHVKSFCSAETAVVLLQLCLWSQLGVLTRIYLDRLFNDGCGDGWGLCLTSQSTRDKQYGAQFFDLPANMLGCFFMGFFSTASVLGLNSKKSLAFLPARSHLQKQKDLQVGLRTGYCGSLTTFASWELALLQLLIGSKGGDGGQWQQWLWGYIIGFELAYASHLIGEHAALGIHRWILPEGSQDPDKEEVNRFERPSDAQEEGEDLYGSQELEEVFEGDQSHAGQGLEQNGQHSGQGVEMSHFSRPTEAAQEGDDLYGTADSHQVLTARNLQSQSDLENGKHPRRRKKSAGDVDKPEQKNRAKTSDKASAAASFLLTTAACALLCVLLTALWVVLAIVDSERKHSGRRQQWFALLFAPFGCILRWLLSKLNTMEGRPLNWFPVGTFAANMLACAIDFILGGLTNRYSLGYWPVVILPAIRVGYAGSLSTVSTFVAEVRNCLRYMYSYVSQGSTCLHEGLRHLCHNTVTCVTSYLREACISYASFGESCICCLQLSRSHCLIVGCCTLMQVRAQLQGWPEKLHGYLYPFITIATGNILGIVLYGWSVWRTL